MKQVLAWTYLVILVRREHLVHTLLPKEVVLQLISILTSPRSRSCVHPFQFIRSFLPRLLFLKSLQLLQLSFFLLLLAKLVELLLLFELVALMWGVNTNTNGKKNATHSLLLLDPHPLLVFEQERVPRLLHVQVATTHVGILSGG